MFSTRRSITSFLFAAALAISACGNNADRADVDNDATQPAPVTEPQSPPDTTAATTPGTTPVATEAAPSSEGAGQGEPGAKFTDEANRAVLENIADGYRNVVGAWKGFDPADHPVVLAVRDDDDNLLGALAINHPQPDELGEATAIDTDGLPFASAHKIENPADATKLSQIPTFEFNIQLGGVDSFAMVAGGADAFFDPLPKDYVSTLLHEMFHRYQNEAFAFGGFQDVEGYAYTKENLELAVLEERALAAAVQATDDQARETAAKHFVAIRIARLAADPRVSLDNDQETGEGTARYLEHRLSADAPGYLFNSNNYGDDLVVSFNRADAVKEVFGFGRWYASGAAVLSLLDDFGVDDKEARIEAGEAPAVVLADVLGVTESDAAELVDAARSIYDADGELSEQAAAAAERAETEGSVFGDDGGSGVNPDEYDDSFDSDSFDDDSFDDDGGEGSEITDEELQCMKDEGTDITGDSAIISEEVVETCFS